MQFTPRVTVSARATANVNVNNPPNTIDGWVLIGGDFLWLTGQTDPSENGVWIKSRVPDPDHPSGLLTRAAHFGDILPDIHVLYGTVSYDKVYHYDTGTSSYVAYTQPPESWRDGLTADLDDFYVTSDGMVELVAGQPEPNFRKAFERLHDSGCSTGTLKRRKRYGSDRAWEVKRKLNLIGNSTLNVANNTEVRFRDSHGIKFLFADSTPDTQGGWGHVEGLCLRYMGSHLETTAYHGLNIETPCTGQNITTQDFPGHGLHSVADVFATPKTGANLLRFSSCRFYQSGLSGIYLAGGDANASAFFGMDTTACGKRNFGAVKARYTLRLTNTTGVDRVINVGRQVWKDKRWGLYYFSVNVGSGLIPASGYLDITIEAYNRSLEVELKAQGKNVLGTGTQFGWGTEYNIPLPNTITDLVYSDESLTGITFTNPSGPAVLAVHGDHHGIWDDAFLGNAFYGCHSTAPGGRHYLALKTGGSKFDGCYCEIGNFGEVAAPNFHAGGLWADPPGMQSNGIGRSTSDLALPPSTTQTQGARGVTFRLCRNKTNEAFQCTDASDMVQGLKFGRTTGGRLANAWCFTHSNQQVAGVSDPNDQRRAGHWLEPRGPVFGNPGVRMSSGATLPAQSLDAPAPGFADVWNVGDIFFKTATTGQPWMHCLTAKVLASGTTYNLTWAAALNRP